VPIALARAQRSVRDRAKRVAARSRKYEGVEPQRSLRPQRPKPRRRRPALTFERPARRGNPFVQAAERELTRTDARRLPLWRFYQPPELTARKEHRDRKEREEER
jgi:hypothetical protein